ncbi:hypothetical protein F5Y19DRAFT_488365 [Xylariaceae sp. FL1651]|nr:hypothetical protein F5Y19DRAFT_488365 [Xylariaceae sp. FL1651]
MARFRNQQSAFNAPIGPVEDIHFLITKSRQVTDPRDAVYGYLCLFPSLLPAGQQPSYEETVASVHASSTKQHIHAARKLDIVSAIEPLAQSRTDLSSWAIDWLDNGNRLMSRANYACGPRFKSYNRPDLFGDAAVLPIKSTFVGTVARVIDFPATHWEFLDVLTVAQTLVAFENAAIETRRGEHDNFTIWMTIYQNTCILQCRGVKGDRKDRLKFHSADLAAVKAWGASLETVADTKMSDYYKQYAHGTNTACAAILMTNVEGISSKRKVIRTSYCVLDSGRIGACAKGVIPGDRVFVIKGLGQPVALRAVADVEIQGMPSPKKRITWMSRVAPWIVQKERPQLYFSGRYSFLGCVYVDGIMDGEVVSEQTAWDLLHLI